MQKTWQTKALAFGACSALVSRGSGVRRPWVSQVKVVAQEEEGPQQFLLENKKGEPPYPTQTHHSLKPPNPQTGQPTAHGQITFHPGLRIREIPFK